MAGSTNNHDSHLERDLRTAIEASGASVRANPANRTEQPDIVFDVGGRTFVVELKVAPENRAALLQGSIAVALLQARRHAASLDATPLAVVGVERLTDRSFREVAEFMAREAPDTAWGMIDRHGRRAFRGLVEVELDSAGEHRPRRPLVRVERDPFSDLGQWLAKVLVAQRLPRTLLAAPRRKLTRARHLAQAARVSEPTTAAWVKLLRGRGFVDDASHELRLVRVREYFERWRSAVSAKPRRVFAARFSLPAGSADEQLHRALAGYPFQVLHRDEPSADGPAPSLRWTDVPRACLGLFEASAALGGIFVKNAPLHLYLETVDDETLRRFGLELAANERTQVRVIEPPWPETVFRGAVPAQTRSGRVVPSCDLLQVWLDVADHPVRGREQADAIERDVLAPKLFDET